MRGPRRRERVLARARADGLGRGGRRRPREARLARRRVEVVRVRPARARRGRPEPARVEDHVVSRARHALLRVERPEEHCVGAGGTRRAWLSVSFLLERAVRTRQTREGALGEHAVPVNADAGRQRDSRTLARGRLELPALTTPSKKSRAAESRVALLLLVGAYLTRPAGARFQDISRPAHAVRRRRVQNAGREREVRFAQHTSTCRA